MPLENINQKNSCVILLYCAKFRIENNLKWVRTKGNVFDLPFLRLLFRARGTEILSLCLLHITHETNINYSPIEEDTLMDKETLLDGLIDKEALSLLLNDPD